MGGGKFLRNTDTHVQDYMVSKLKIPQLTSSSPRDPQISSIPCIDLTLSTTHFGDTSFAIRCTHTGTGTSDQIQIALNSKFHFMAVRKTMLFFWVVMPCRIVGRRNVSEKHTVYICRVQPCRAEP
jgi:hypothetical protein